MGAIRQRPSFPKPAAFAHCVRQFQGCNHAVGFGKRVAIGCFASKIEGSPVIGRGSDIGQAKGDIDPVIKGQSLDRNECLIMARAQGNVVGCAGALVEQGVGR